MSPEDNDIRKNSEKVKMGPFYSGFIQNLGVLHKHTPQGLDSFYHDSNMGKRDKYTADQLVAQLVHHLIKATLMLHISGSYQTIQLKK